MRTRSRPRRAGLRPRTLRARLAVGLATVLLLGLAATAFATTALLRGFLLQRLDTQLADAGGRYSASLEYGAGNLVGGDGDADNAAGGQTVGTLGVRVYQGRITQAAVVGDDGDNSDAHLGPQDVRRLVALRAGSPARTLHLDALGDYRIQAVAGHDNDVQITGLPMHGVDETTARLLFIELSIAAAVVVAGVAVTVAVVRRTMRPLALVTDTALAVSELPLTDPATPLPARIGPARAASEIDQLGAAFDHMLDHVRSALAARDLTEARLRQFVADASHELRTPLATVRAYAEYARRGDTDLPPPTATALERIDSATQRMSLLVEDLLLLARLDAGRPLARETVDLSHLALDTVQDARTSGPDHHWRLQLPDEPVTTVGDPQRLHQVMSNLVGNARRHTPPGTTVTVAVARSAATVTVSVSDDGPGIPPAILPTVFDRFSRADPARVGPAAQDGGAGSDGAGAGTGLGLAIAHGIAVAHHGSLEVDSTPGGTRFVLRIPAGDGEPLDTL